MFITNSKKTIKTFVSGILAIVLILLSFQSLSVLRPEATTQAAGASEAMGLKCVEDNFDSYANGTNIHEQNGWISQKRDAYSEGVVYQSHQVENGTLKAIEPNKGNNGWTTFVTMRSMDDAAVNQRASVDILNLDNNDNNAFANLHLRYMISADYKTATNFRPCPNYNYFVSVNRSYLVINAQLVPTAPASGNGWWGSDTKSELSKVAISGEDYKEGHTYRVEFIAQGTNPTTLTATLYDVTDDMRVVATTSATDSTAALQKAGTVALSHRGNTEASREYTIFDNFKYEETDVILANFEEDFTDGSYDSGWSVSAANTTFNTDNEYLYMKKENNNGTECDEHEAAFTLPLSKAQVDQTAEVEFNFVGAKENLGAVVYTRVQDQRPNDNNNYRALCLIKDSGNQKAIVQIYAGPTKIFEDEHDYEYASAKHRLSLSAEKVSDTETKLSVTLLKWEDNTWKTRVTGTVTDSTASLQGAGTAGFTLHKKWMSTEAKFYSFSYKSVGTVTAFNALEAENENVHKNKYIAADRTDTFGETAVNQVAGGVNTAEANLASTLNHDGAFVAYAINAEAAGNYPIRAILKMSGANAAAYAAADKYVMLVANGASYKLNYYAPLDTYATTTEASVALNEGTNIVYIYAPTAALADAAPGITVDYDKLYGAAGLSIIEGGSFAAAGDANSDNSADVRDLVRFKRFIKNNDSVDVNYDAMGYLLNNSNAESWNNASFETLRSFILAMGTADTTFAEKSWLMYTAPRSVNPLAIIADMEGGADAQALSMQNSIVTAASEITAASSTTGKVYYFSSLNGNDNNNGTSPSTPKASPYRLKDMNLNAGDVVLFERGSVFRQGNNISQTNETYNWQNCLVELKSGVSYGAYGNANSPKPVFSGSARNYAGSAVGWTQHDTNIWKCSLPLQDAGVMVMDDGTVGILKTSLGDLTQGNEFYHDVNGKTLYLYCAEGNPSEVFNSIEIGVDRPIFAAQGGVSNVKIDNLSLKYGGAHGMDFLNDNNNNTIMNCELSWIGGSIQYINEDNGRPVRYGNAIQFWSNASGNTVRDCWVHDIYDAGLTFQGNNGSDYNNIAFTSNLIQRCCYSVEFFIKLPTDSSTPAGSLKNITINQNIMQFAGYGFTQQREEIEKASHVNGWTTDVFANTENVKIQQNTFDISRRNILYWNSTERPTNVTVVNNTYYQARTAKNVAILWGAENQYTANSKDTLVTAISNLGDNVAVENKEAQINWLIK